MAASRSVHLRPVTASPRLNQEALLCCPPPPPIHFVGHPLVKERGLSVAVGPPVLGVGGHEDVTRWWFLWGNNWVGWVGGPKLRVCQQKQARYPT